MNSLNGPRHGPCVGIVLCGGGSMRMGRDKAMLPFRDGTMLKSVVDAVAAVTGRVVVVAAPAQILPNLSPTVTVLRDPVPDVGPLAGLLTAMQTIGESAEIVTLCGCDTPLLRPELLRRVIDRLDVDHEAALPVIDDVPQPLAGVYRTSLLPTVRQLRNEERRSLRSLLDRCRWQGLKKAEFADVDPDLESLRNINTPEDYDGLSGGKSEESASP